MAKTIGQFIKHARKSVNASQQDLVKTVQSNYPGDNLSRRHLSNIELGTKGVSVDTLNLITHALIDLGAK